jgi:hypothetical protein
MTQLGNLCVSVFICGSKPQPGSLKGSQRVAKIKIRVDGFRVVTIFDGGNLTKLARQKKSFDRPPYG